MNHDFAIIDDEKLLKIINNIHSLKKLKLLDKLYLRKKFFEISSKDFDIIHLSDKIFRRLNYIEFECFTNTKIIKSETFNYYGITIIPFYSLEILKRSFLNITYDEEYRLKEINITENEYKKIINDLIELFDYALREKKAIIHFGI